MKKFYSYIKKLGNYSPYSVVPDTWKKLRQCDILLINHENDRSFNFEGRSYSPLLDSIAEILVRQGHKLEFVSSFFSKEHPSHSWNGYKSINRLAIQNQILGDFLRRGTIKSDTITWQKILETCKPRIIIAIQPTKPLCLAAHSMGCRVYDFQHGGIVSGMKYYGQKFNSDSKPEELPTGFLSWDSGSAEVMQMWAPAKGIQVSVVGNPWLHRFSFIRENDLLVHDELKKIPSLKDERKRILVTLQWGLGRHFPDFFTDSSDIHPELARLILTRKDVQWMIRLHPNMIRNKEYFQSIKDQFQGLPHIEIDISSKVALPALLHLVSAHITWTSSCVIEAAKFNIPSFVMNPAESGVFMKIDTKESTGKLPFEAEEKMGLVQRSSGAVNFLEMNEWIDNLSLKKTAHAKTMFYEDEFFRILKGMT